MKKFNVVIVSAISLLLCIFCISSTNLSAVGASVKQAPSQTKAVKTETIPTENTATPQNYSYTPVKSLDLVQNPSAYLNKRVKVVAKFDKFSSLGLDYQPALRSSEKYITFLIMRDDVENDIPLSELKNFMKREVAEKYIDLDTGDVIEYSGLLFSDALGDAWLDVENFKIVSSKSKSNKTK